jgi:two-component system, LuxR family, response regulator FixJ
MTQEAVMLDKSDWDASASSPAITRPGAEIFIVDDEPMIGDLLNGVFSSEGYRVTTFSDGEAFNAVTRSRAPPACVVLDFLMPRRSGLDILRDVNAHNYAAPIVIMSGIVSVPMAVEAIRSGAFDVIEKPFAIGRIVKCVRGAIDACVQHRMSSRNYRDLWTNGSAHQGLTLREAEVLDLILDAASNKEAAQHLGISPRTIEIHRAHIMAKLGAKNTADLVRIALAKQRYRATRQKGRLRSQLGI